VTTAGVPTMVLTRGARLLEESQVNYGLEYEAGKLLLCANPGDTLLTATGSVAGDALNLQALGVHTVAHFGTVAAGTGAMIPIYSLGGAPYWIINDGANALTIYPQPTGTIDGSASISVSAGGRKMLMSKCASSGLDWAVVI